MHSFQQLCLPKELNQALKHLNFTEPTKVQSAVIPVLLEGKDLMACSETGSGKTAAYGIPLLSKLLADPKSNALILAPTRELVYQIADFLKKLTAHSQNIQIASLVGGADIRKQFRMLKKRPRIIVATPGRLIDHLNRKSLRLTSTKNLVLDEGDRMLDMGFSPQLDEILTYLPQIRQTSLFTATLPQKVRRLAQMYLSNSEEINIGSISKPPEAIHQKVAQVTAQQKENRLMDELNQRKGSVIIFSKTKRQTEKLSRHLGESGYSVELIHGGRSQGQRDKAIQNFKKGRRRILCATDIASRGMDIPQVEHVINFDLPMMCEDYVHRIGRTARNGASGEALSFVEPSEHQSWKKISKKYQIKGVELKGSKPKRSYLDQKKRSKRKAT